MSTHNITLQYMRNIFNYSKSAAIGFFSKELKNEFETAMVNEQSVFEPQKVNCSWF